MKTASIVIPFYNQLAYLPAALDSALSQTYPAEVIVVDDGSTEDLSALRAAYQGRVTFLRQENRGLAAARNAGFRASRGDFLIFLDADDLLDPRILECCIERLEAEPDLALVYTAWKQVSADGQTFYTDVFPAYSGQILEPLLLRRFFFFISGAVVRRKTLERTGLFDETLRWGEDADLWLRIAATGYHFGCLRETLLTYRVYNLSMTARVTPEQVDGWLFVLEKFFSTPGLPEEIHALKSQAYAVLYFETAGRYFRMGQLDLARQQLRLAAGSSPRVSESWFLDWLAGTANDPRTTRPLEFIQLVLDSLPEELAYLRLLRRQALGRYHTAAAFANYSSGRLAAARRHIWPALRGDPGVLANTGFISMTIKVLRKAGKLAE